MDRGLAAPLGELEFCVLDVETSGLDARRDRILEIAIVRVRGDGTVLDEYATLVSGSPVAATAVHGITECDLVGAPTMAQIAGDVRARLSAAVLAGHNVVFDLAFVSAAFARVGWPLSSRPWICTMALARLLEQTPGRIGLRAACEQQGLLVSAQHSALGDARAAAQLLTCYLQAAHASGLTLADLARRRPRAACGASWRHPMPSEPLMAAGEGWCTPRPTLRK